MKLNLIESLGSSEYTPPKDVRVLMVDFYTLQMLEAQPLKVGERSDQLKYEIDYCTSKIINYLKPHLLEKAGYSIICEIRHLYNKGFFRRNSDTNKANVNVRNAYTKVAMPSAVTYFYASQQNPESSFDRMSYSYYETKVLPVLYDVVLACKKLYEIPGQAGFTSDHAWGSGYGGIAWAKCCEVWLELYRATKKNDIIRFIDIMYSIEHNTGGLLNKNIEYRNFRKLLDLKFEAVTVEELTPYASTYVQRLAKFIRGNKIKEESINHNKPISENQLNQ